MAYLQKRIRWPPKTHQLGPKTGFMALKRQARPRKRAGRAL